MQNQILQDTHIQEQGRQHLVLHALFMAFICLLICVDLVYCSGLISLEHLVCSMCRKEPIEKRDLLKFFRTKGQIWNIMKHLASE